MDADRPLILVIEDDPPIRAFLRAALPGKGYRVVEAATGREGLERAASEPPELVILDLGLPDMDGLDLIDRLREWTPVPIIVLSARGREQDKVSALDRGADDYLTKPFGIAELLARLRVALRHAARAGREDAEPSFQAGDLKVDLAGRRVFLGDEPVRLTPTEYRLLATLVRHAGRVLTHGFLLREVWGPRHSDDPRYIRVFVASLRRKIEKDPARPRHLVTEQGVGYRLVDE